MFYWMRLFNHTAFFMNLLSKTFEDVNFKAFMIMLIILILTYGNVMYILNTERGKGFEYEDEDNVKQNVRIYPNDLPSDFFNAIIYSYKLCLGDFSTNGYVGNNSWFIWVLFALSTFLLQITFLNMLIAIMGNTFTNVSEKKQQSAMKERIAILSDFRLVVRALKLDSEFQYIFVVRPLVE